MILTCSRAECGVEFRSRNARKYCGKECSGLAHRRPRGNCLICGKPLTGPTQRVACSSKCAGSIGGLGNAHDQGVWGVGGANSADCLRVLWDEGHSTSEIGRRMDITKNAVIGKAHRLGLPARPSPIRGIVGQGRTYASKQHPLGERTYTPRAPRVTLPALASIAIPVVRAARKAPPQPPQRAPEAPKPPAAPKRRPEAETLLPRAGTPPVWGLCQWPMEAGGWCGAKAEPSRPYCRSHCAIAYVRVRDRREDWALECAAA